MRISNEKKEKISEQILAFLFTNSPKSFFTSQIAKELARDEEFIKKILEDLNKKNLIINIKKNPKGINYKRRNRWKLTDYTYKIYKNL